MAKNQEQGFFTWETKATILCNGNIVVRLYERFHHLMTMMEERTFCRTFSIKEIASFVSANRCEYYAVPVLMGKLNRNNNDFESALRYNQCEQGMLVENNIINPVYRREVSNYLMNAEYLAFRMIYSAGSDNPQNLFTLDERRWHNRIAASMLLDTELAESVIEQEQLALPLSPDILSGYFEKGASSLFNLIQFAERNVRTSLNGQ